MDKLESRLKKLNNWEYELYLLIKKFLTANTKNYKVPKDELDKKLESIFLNSWDVIEGNTQKYLIVNENKRSDENERDYNIRVLLNPNYMLNKNEVIPYIYKTYISRLIEKWDFKEKYERANKRAEEMTGKKLTDKKRKKYLKILEKQKELISTYGRNSRKSSLPSAIRAEHKLLLPPKVGSIYRTIRYHQKKGNLPK